MEYETLKRAVDANNTGSLNLERINSFKYEYFVEAAEQEHLNVLEFLLHITPNIAEKSRMIHDDNNFAFRVAAQNGQLDVLKYLVDLTPDPTEQSKMIYTDEDTPFILAVKGGHLNVLEFLLYITPSVEGKSRMIHDYEDWAFWMAAENGQLDVLKYLVDLTPDLKEQSNMIHADDNYAFGIAAHNGQLDVLKYLIDLTPNPEEQLRMIHAHDNRAFIYAARKERLDVLKYLIDLTPNSEEQLRMIHAYNNGAFEMAAGNGHFEVLKYLVSITEFTNLPVLNLVKKKEAIDSYLLPDLSLVKEKEEFARYVDSVNRFIISVKTNDLIKLDELFGIIRKEGKIVGIDEEGSITLDMVHKAISFCKNNNNLEQSQALLEEISQHAKWQRSLIVNELNEYVPEVLINIIKEYAGPTSIIKQEAPAPQVQEDVIMQEIPTSITDMMQLDTPRNR